ncbi:hypothetical protein BDR06DRAFT_1005724 [Suillus hirtellus]|nr:hypothetical protein BDR06DRAFT_1005724 [Suillus hirtellus]
MKGVLEDRLIHQCLNIVLEPLKQSAQHGVMLSDPIGCNQYCFTALASYIADTPEAMMLAAIGGKTSLVMMAMYKQFGDAFHHESWTKSTTIAQLTVVRSCADPNDIEAYFCEAQKFRLNGIDKPFWWDYALADPFQFLTLESLHHLHKEFFDHDTQWLICAVGDSEIDFRFSVLQPITSYQHFYSGISKLKQVTGHYAAPPHVITAVCALMQFWYLIQLPHIDEKDLRHISGALTEFHMNKDAILAAGAHWGKGNRHINNFYIPKLELMQSIIPSICNSGVIGQWSADITEHAHITEIKDPARSSNNNNYNTQICRHLNCAEKCRRFELATSLLDHRQRGEEEGLDLDAEDSNIEADVETEDVPIDPTQHPCQTTNYFAITKALQH